MLYGWRSKDLVRWSRFALNNQTEKSRQYVTDKGKRALIERARRDSAEGK